MKHFSKILLAAVAASVMMAPLANAQSRNYDQRPAYDRVDKRGPQVQKKNFKKQQVRRNWKRGDRYADWRRHSPVRDYHRYGLKSPPRGHQWVRVGNDYLLVGIASGIIASIIVGR